eukprot:CAMPEP_0204382598 /NCGR_PEP_ID=MMETSP0469-20131031/55238_1 /ASSEMBLY_ACC=CAM_ASM_000384 /TAXON_ID=2969 /ORGANISM="Oxyrrhis marina" /LENGTH=50 /DNA_ID=CAMNT_0051374711 /DNA_START=12 /DNA_END=161 /DNA_ORIENTATION=+
MVELAQCWTQHDINNPPAPLTTISLNTKHLTGEQDTQTSNVTRSSSTNNC